MSDLEDSNDDVTSPKKGKKKYYPFGTPTHNSMPYSKFAHINNPQTQNFAAHLSSSESNVQVREPEPRKAKRAVKKPAGKTGTNSTATTEPPAAAEIPDAEGLEPCTKIACQVVIRAIGDLQIRNEIERDEIEDEYERLLQDLAAAEQEIAAAESKLVSLNEIGSQLEMRSNQLQEKVDSLQNTKDAQDTERNDINGKLMICQTDKNKRARALDKAIKALSDATWRKKKKEQQENAEAGLTLAASSISENPILHTDTSTVASLGSIYKTSYNQLAAEKVRDVIELPPPVKTLPPFMSELLAQPSEVRSLDKYAQRHYKQVMEHNVKSWEGMEGSLITSSIYSASSKGFGPAVVAESFEQYSRIRASKGGGMSSSITTAASSRVGTLLQRRSGIAAEGSTASTLRTSNDIDAPQSTNNSISQLEKLSHLIHSRENSPSGSKRGKASHVSGKYRHPKKSESRSGSGQVRLAPLSKQPAQQTSQQASQHQQVKNSGMGRMGIGETGLDDVDGFSAYGYGEDGDGTVDGGHDGALSVSQFSALSADSHLLNGSLSPQSLSMSLSTGEFNPFGDGSSVAEGRKLDPVFYKDKSRYHFARKHAVGKLRKAEITWGMKAYIDPNRQGDGVNDDEGEGTVSSKVKPGMLQRRATSKVNVSAAVSHAGSSRASTANTSRGFRDPLAPPIPEPTVKSRSLTVYHPNMQIFQDAAALPKKSVEVE